MKSPTLVLGDVAERLRRQWSHVVVGGVWSPQFHLGTSGLTGQRLAAVWSEVHQESIVWQEWAAGIGEEVTLLTRSASVHGTAQSLPATLVVPTVDTAAGLLGGEWALRLERARSRNVLLAERFPALLDPAAVL